MTPTAPAVLPCPFCAFVQTVRLTNNQVDPPRYARMCGLCAAKTNEFQTEAEALAAWNRRTPAPGAAAMREACAKVADELGERADKVYSGEQMAYFIGNAIRAMPLPAGEAADYVLVPRDLLAEAPEWVRHGLYCSGLGKPDEDCNCGAVDYVRRILDVIAAAPATPRATEAELLRLAELIRAQTTADGLEAARIAFKAALRAALAGVRT